MLSEKVQNALNAQINAEFWSAYLYLSMSVDAMQKGYKGISSWFMVQFQEEQAHARIFVNYVLSRGGKVKLSPIAAVKTEWSSPLSMFEDTLMHEQKVTAMIDELCAVAMAEKDFATNNILTWFVNEQVEEEDSARTIIDELKMVEGNSVGLFMIDKELATRTYVTPAPLATA